MSFRMLQADVLRWAKDKDLLHAENAPKQFMKFIEEVCEFKTEFDMWSWYEKFNFDESLKTYLSNNNINRCKDLNMFEIIKVDELNEKESEMKEKEIIDYVLEELEYLESTYYNSIYDYEEEGGDVCDCISDDLKELIDNIKNRVGRNAGVNSTPYSFKELQYYILKWAEDKDLLHRENSEKQFMKFIEEVFEFKTEMDMLDNCGESLMTINLEHVKDEMGDIFVTLIILCEQLGIDPMGCLELAYNKIKKRKGKTINGQFIKEEDL